MKSSVSLLIILGILAILNSCAKESSSGDTTSKSTETGAGGSMARFTIAGDYLYTVDNDSLKLFFISDPNSPAYLGSLYIGQNIETIFPFGNKLFIGSRSGMFIYSIASPSNPAKLCQYQHIYSCDPVVADSQYAYVTLHSEGSRCGRNENELHIIDYTTNIYNPVEVARYAMTSPRGLGIDDSTLFVCDAGLKVYNASDVEHLVLKHYFKITANDVIPYSGNLMVIGSDGLYQYSYTNDTINLLSKLSVVK